MTAGASVGDRAASRLFGALCEDIGVQDLLCFVQLKSGQLRGRLEPTLNVTHWSTVEVQEQRFSVQAIVTLAKCQIAYT